MADESTGETLSVEDIVTALGDDPKESPKEKETKEEPKEPKLKTLLEDEPDDEESEEPKEEELELKDPEEEIEETEDDIYTDRPTRAAILKKYPEVFKDFPGLEKDYFRAQQYTEVFPTIKEARAAREELDSFNQFQGELLNGSIDGILESVKRTSETAFNNITGNLLKTLEKTNKEAYLGTINHVFKNSLNFAFTKGKEMGGEDGEQLQIAAQLLHKYVYGSTTVTPSELAKPEEPSVEQKQLAQERQAFATERFNGAVNEIVTKVDRTIKSAVEQVIDKRAIMTDYVKSKAIKDVNEQLQEALKSDARFVAHKDMLWKEAARLGFTESSKTKIREALIKKSKSLLPGIINKVRADALKGYSTRTREASDSRDEKPISSGKPASSSNAPRGSGKGKVPSGMTTLDFLNSD